MANKSSNSKSPAVSPFSTGGGGNRFELLVAVHYLIALLRQESARGMELGIVQEVRLQQRNMDCPVDDIFVLCRMSNRSYRLYLQVKHDLTFSKNAVFCEVVNQAWQQLNSKDFIKGHDKIGVVIGEKCNNRTVKGDLADLLSWAFAASSPLSFYRKISKFSAKVKLLNVFENALKPILGRSLKQKDTYLLLRHMIVLAFDLEPATGRDSIAANNLLKESVSNSNVNDAAGLADLLYKMAADYAKSAGDITLSDISRRISDRASYSVPILLRARQSITELLESRLKNRLAAEKNSKKYIPEIFVEIGDLKDSARLFCHPVLFSRQLSDNNAIIDLFDINRHLEMIGIPPLLLQLPSQPHKYEDLQLFSQSIINNLSAIDTQLAQIKRNNCSKLFSYVSQDKVDTFNEVASRIGSIAHGLMEYEIRPLMKRVNIITSRVMGIIAKAGNGKTNFVCDLAEHFLLPHNIPCAYFTGKDLGEVRINQLEEFIARSIHATMYSGDISALLEEINSSAEKIGTAGIILIDAINEHPDLSVFAKELERFIQTCIRYPRIRVIFTCRSEFFDVRFGNLKTSSFSNQLVIEDNIQNRMTYEHKCRMVYGYFDFFKLDVQKMSDSVRQQFDEDPFLLRMYCEAYGDSNSKKQKIIKRLLTIRREAMFRMYFQRKMDSLQHMSRMRTGYLSGSGDRYRDVLRSIIKWMVDEKQYADFPISVCELNNLNELDDIIGEDILFRRDLKPDSVLGNREVLNFTFDACRDFLLADYLVSVTAKQSREKFSELVSQLTDQQNTVSEGLREYLFFSTRYHSDLSLLNIVEKQSWYESTYVQYVFDLEEDAISVKDGERLKRLCLEQHNYTPRITIGLILRYDHELHPNANIGTLFEIFDSLDQDSFESLCLKIAGARFHGVGGGIFSIDQMVDYFQGIILSSEYCKTSYRNLGRMVLYLWNVMGSRYDYPARILYGKYEKKHPSIASELKSDHIKMNRKGFTKEYDYKAIYE